MFDDNRKEGKIPRRSEWKQFTHFSFFFVHIVQNGVSVWHFFPVPSSDSHLGNNFCIVMLNVWSCQNEVMSNLNQKRKLPCNRSIIWGDICVTDDKTKCLLNLLHTKSNFFNHTSVCVTESDCDRKWSRKGIPEIKESSFRFAAVRIKRWIVSNEKPIGNFSSSTDSWIFYHHFLLLLLVLLGKTCVLPSHLFGC